MMIGARRNPWDQMGMEAAPVVMDIPQVSLPQGAPQAPKAKINWGAVIADALSGLAGQQGQYPQRVARERAEQTDFERGEQRYQRQRADSREDFLWKQQNDKPNPYRVQDNAGNYHEMQPDGSFKPIFIDKAPKQYIQDGMVINVPNPYNGASPLPAPPPVIDDALWNSGKPVGGPMPPASGTFRRPY